LVFKTASQRAGLRRIRWHDCRHSFASQLTSAGVPLRQVQDYLGHSTIAMTMRYAHLAPGDGADVRRALNRSPENQGNSMASAPSETAASAAS
jgi:site-specific recombinase XerD